MTWEVDVCYFWQAVCKYARRAANYKVCDRLHQLFFLYSMAFFAGRRIHIFDSVALVASAGRKVDPSESFTKFFVGDRAQVGEGPGVDTCLYSVCRVICLVFRLSILVLILA